MGFQLSFAANAVEAKDVKTSGDIYLFVNILAVEWWYEGYCNPVVMVKCLDFRY